MLPLLAAITLACAEPDGGACQQQVNIGPFNPTQVWPGGGGMGQYTTYIWQSPTSPATACFMATTYIGVCSSFARSPLGPTGNGGSLGLQNGGHRQVLWSDWSDFSPDADDFAELGAVGYRWKRITSYEHVIAARSMTCTVASDGGCANTDAPRGSSILFTCPTPNGCQWTPGEWYQDNTWHQVRDGMQVCIRNISDNPLLVLDAPGTIELEGDFSGGQFALLCMERRLGRWLETRRSYP